jgi:hypothetical protein
MKRLKIYFVFFLFAFFANILNAQNVLTKPLQFYRPGDKLVKQQIEYKDPGRSGTNVLWDFSTLKPINENYRVSYRSTTHKRGGDSVSIIGQEHQTMYKYVLKGDSVLLMGYENSGSRKTYSSPEYVMHFPFSLGDSIVSNFKGEGSFEHTLSTGSEGTLYVVADAVGTLILPDGDTLFNVLRIKSQHDFMQKTRPLVNPRLQRMLLTKDSVQSKLHEDESTNIVVADSAETSENVSEKPLNAKEMMKTTIKTGNQKRGREHSEVDSLYFRTVSYKWYAPGYRYPLFETICNFGRWERRDTSESNDFSTAFYYPPTQHTYLEDDLENKAILDSLKNIRHTVYSNPNDTLLFDFNFYPNPVRNDLNVELLLDYFSEVVLSVYTTSGNKVFSQDEGWNAPGRHNYTLRLDRLRMGEYLLYIRVNQQIARTTLIKL